MDSSSWAKLLAQLFPKLSSEGYKTINEPTERYNCIAYAAGDTNTWWDLGRKRFWPDYATRTYRIESLIEVFAGLGFQQCQDSGFERGFEKVALYEERGLWKHAALQTSVGRWRSKMGQGPLIEHNSPESLAGGVYGNPMTIMRRSVNYVPDSE